MFGLTEDVPALVGRERERERIEALIAEARSGRGGTLVIRGEPGIGKTALLQHAAWRAADMRILRTVSVESESELPFAALHELVRPILDHLDALPEPQQTTLRGAFALSPVRSVDPFAVHVAARDLLAAAAERRPLLCLIDDAQWLDTASSEALAFVCRRLRFEGIAMLFAARAGTEGPLDARGLPDLDLGGLDAASAAAILRRSTVPLSRAAIERVIAVAKGNPLALHEIPLALTGREISSTDQLDEPLPVGERVERAFARRVASLSDEAQWGLLVAAASDSPQVAELLAVLGSGALDEAEAAALIAIDGERYQFRHPLVRSAVYHSAAPARRRAAHGALAAVTADRASHAWHLAAATVGPSDEVAVALEAAAAEAAAHGAPAVAMAAFERAARSTRDPEVRARRLLAAGQAAWAAGRTSDASRLLDRALGTTSDPVLRADVQAARSQVVAWTTSATAASELLFGEAAHIATIDPGRSAMMLISASLPSVMAGRIAQALEAVVRAREIATGVPGFPIEILDSIGAVPLILTGQDSEARPALLAASAIEVPGPFGDTLSAQTAQALIWIGEYDAARAAIERRIERARREGAFNLLSWAFAGLADLHLRAGRLRDAYAAALRSLQLATDTGEEVGSSYSSAILARVEAALGREADCLAHVERALVIARDRGIESVEPWAWSALGLLHLGLGRTAEAVAALERVQELAERHGLRHVNVIQWMPDLIEAHARAGDPDKARRLLQEFARMASPTPGPWALATVARCRALLSDDSGFVTAFEQALALHADVPSAFEHARTTLLFGERLRRAHRRGDARVQLRSALDAFERISASSWASRSRLELAADGEHVRQEPAGDDELTPQELQVALLVAEGKTNRETAAALFLSPKTVEFHLHRVFLKLRVRSRTELAMRVASGEVLRQRR